MVLYQCIANDAVSQPHNDRDEWLVMAEDDDDVQTLKRVASTGLAGGAVLENCW